MAVGLSVPRRVQGRVNSRRVIELVAERRQHAIRGHDSTYRKLPQYYDMMRGSWTGSRSQFRNNVSIPFIFAAVQSDVARKVQTSLGGWPIVEFSGHAPEDQARAKKNEILVSAQMKDANSFIKGVDFFFSADMYGTGIARYGWKNVTRRFKVRFFDEIAPGVRSERVESYNAEHFNGPNWDVVDPLDFWPQPGKKFISDMGWVIHRYWLDLDDMRDDALSPNPYFDQSAVRLLEQAPLTTEAYTEFQARQHTYRGSRDHAMRSQEKFAKPVEVWEMWGLVPREFAPDGVRERCIAIGNGRVVLKNRENPFPDGQKPFKAYSPMPDPHEFWAMGKVEVAAKLQRTANRLANQKLDAIDLTIDPMWIAGGQSGLNTQSLFTRSGRVLLTDGTADESNLRAVSPDLRGLQQAYPEIASIWQYIQLGMGTNDVALGQAGQRETARGTLTRQENLLTRLMLEARLAEEGFIEPLANAFRNMDRQFLRLPHEVKILGSLATTNPITGMPLPNEPVNIDVDDMVPDYRARAIGATQQTGKSLRQQNFIGLFQILSANQQMGMIVNWVNFARQMFELFDFKNVDELLNIEQVPLVNQVAQQTGQSPQAVGQAAGASSLEELDPEIIGQLLGGQGASPLGGI